MKIVDMNVRITLQKAEYNTDEIGNHTHLWTDYLNLYSYVSFEGKGEEVFLGMEVDRSDISFTVRYQQALADVDVSNYRICFKDEVYNIISVDFMNYKKRYVKFRCKKVVEW